MQDGVFVVGTDTGVGKTRVTGWIAQSLASRGIAVGICKPAVTGAQVLPDGRLVWGDIEQLRPFCTVGCTDAELAPFRWRPPVAPIAAAAMEPSEKLPDVEDYLAALHHWRGKCEFLVVEGVGGLLCPLTLHSTVADIARAWGRPVLIVARAGLGTLNHTLLTVEAAYRRGLSILGVLLNHECPPDEEDPAVRSNPEQLRRLLTVPVWGPIPYTTGPELPSLVAKIPWNELTPSDRQPEVHHGDQ